MSQTFSRARDGSDSGFTMCELLVSSLVAAVVLGAGWSWLWTANAAAVRDDARAQARTAAAFALRAAAADLRQAFTVTAPPACPPGCGLRLLLVRPGREPEVVDIVWDSARRVLWRKTSSSYLADHVRRFEATCFGPSGEEIGPPGAAPTDDVRLVRLEVDVQLGADVVAAALDVAVGAP